MHTPTRILVITRSWSLDREQLASASDRLSALGAELVVLSSAGAWSFLDDDRVAGDVLTAATLSSTRHCGDAVFVIDGASVVRVGAHAADLNEALDEAAERLTERTSVVSTWNIVDSTETLAAWSSQ